MEKALLGDDIKNKSFARIYFLYGKEPFIIDYYTRQIISAVLGENGGNFDLHEHKGKELSEREFLDEIDALPMVSEKKVILIRDLPLPSGIANRLLSDPGLLNDDTVLVIASEKEDYDRKKKDFKDFLAFAKKNGRTALLDPLDRVDKERWVRKHFAQAGKEISVADITYFLNNVDNNLYFLSSEIKKLVSYTSGKDRITRPDIDAICIKTAEAKGYELSNAITEKNPSRALSVIKTLLDNHEPEHKIAGIIFNTVNLLYRTARYASAGFSVSEIMKRTGEKRDFVIKNYISLIPTLPKGALDTMLELCAETDLKLKTGNLDARILIEQLVLQCIRLQQSGSRK